MPSSISNSESRRRAGGIGEIVLWAAALFVLYAAAIQLWSPDVRAGQSQEADNSIAIERFLYADRIPDAVVVGSSQANRIPDSALGPGVANLSLVNGGALTGLAIILRSGRWPRRVFIEINQIMRKFDPAVVDGALAEPLYTVRRIVKATRTSAEPANLLVSVLRKLTRGTDEVRYPRLTALPLREELIGGQRVALSAPPDPAALAEAVATARRQVAALAAHGVSVVFFEMPFEPSLTRLPGVAVPRRALRDAFPGDRYCWFEGGESPGMATTDGLHLDSDSAAAFARDLLRTRCDAPR